MNELLMVGTGVVCWLVSTLAAGGGAMVVLPVATALLPPRQISPALALASVVSSIQRCIIYRRHINRSIVVHNLAGLVLGVTVGGLLLKAFRAQWILYLIAAFLIAEPVRYFLRRGQAAFRMKTVYFAAASFFTALVSTLVGTAGPIMNPFYLNAGVVKEEMIGTKAASTLLMQVLKVAVFATVGLLTPDVLRYGLLLGAGAVVGNALGKLLLERMRTAWFKHAVQGVLLCTGVLMLYRLLRHSLC